MSISVSFLRQSTARVGTSEMAESTAKVADTTPEVEQKAPEPVVVPTPSPTSVAEEPKVEEAKVEAPERKFFNFRVHL